MRCDQCKAWLIREETAYGDGAVVVGFEAPVGKGKCRALDMETAADFGCLKFEEGSAFDQVITTHKDGAAWENWVMTPCPDCRAAGSSGDTACHRCAGTGNVRLYGDGFCGDERTRKHPKESTPKPVVDPGMILAPTQRRPDVSTAQTVL